MKGLVVQVLKMKFSINLEASHTNLSAVQSKIEEANGHKGEIEMIYRMIIILEVSKAA